MKSHPFPRSDDVRVVVIKPIVRRPLLYVGEKGCRFWHESFDSQHCAPSQQRPFEEALGTQVLGL